MISVIVPIYNVAEYLPRALDSILAQTYKDWEAILVDDGSTDDSPRIVDDYAAKDARFKVIHQSNGGVSAARNTGLDNASGEYIAWVDPDDVAHPDMLEKLVAGINHAGMASVAAVDRNLASKEDKSAGNEQASTEKVDTAKRICISNAPAELIAKLQQEAHEETNVEKYKASVTASATASLALHMMLREDDVHSYLWDKLFSRDIFEDKHLRFPDGLRYEDVRMMPEFFLEADCITVVPDNLYDYTIREDSITGATRLRASEEFFVALRQRAEKLRDTEFYPDARYGLYRHLRRMVYELMSSDISSANDDKNESNVSKRQSDVELIAQGETTSVYTADLIAEARIIYKEIKPTLRGKERIISAIFNLSPGLYKVVRHILP